MKGFSWSSASHCERLVWPGTQSDHICAMCDTALAAALALARYGISRISIVLHPDTLHSAGEVWKSLSMAKCLLQIESASKSACQNWTKKFDLVWYLLTPLKVILRSSLFIKEKGQAYNEPAVIQLPIKKPQAAVNFFYTAISSESQYCPFTVLSKEVVTLIILFCFLATIQLLFFLQLFPILLLMSVLIFSFEGAFFRFPEHFACEILEPVHIF